MPLPSPGDCCTNLMGILYHGYQRKNSAVYAWGSKCVLQFCTAKIYCKYVWQEKSANTINFAQTNTSHIQSDKIFWTASVMCTERFVKTFRIVSPLTIPTTTHTFWIWTISVSRTSLSNLSVHLLSEQLDRVKVGWAGHSLWALTDQRHISITGTVWSDTYWLIKTH